MKDIQTIKAINGSFVIFAAQPNINEDVMAFFVENNIKFKVLLGNYQGKRETAYCVPSEQFSMIVEAGLVQEQESVLELGVMSSSSGLRRATIVYLDGRAVEAAGFFVPVPKEDALKLNGWTFDPMNDKFYAIRTAAELVAAGTPVDEE